MANFITRNIPNTLTCGNLVSGCIATVTALGGEARLALLWIIIGAVFDFFDGLSARLFGVSSPIGKELDSLADDVTFGVAPSAIIFTQLSVMEHPAMLAPVASYVPYFAFVMAAFSALRLAKFNLDTRQTTSFIGMPTPANALFWGSLLVSQVNLVESTPWMTGAILLLICVTSWLLVSEIPMFALKFKQWGWRGNELRYSFVLLSILVEASMGILEGFWVVIALYFVISLISDFMSKKKGEKCVAQ